MTSMTELSLPAYQADQTTDQPPSYESVSRDEDASFELQGLWESSRFHACATLLVPEEPPVSLLRILRQIASPHEIRVGVEMHLKQGLPAWRLPRGPGNSEELVVYVYGLSRESGKARVLADFVAPLRLVLQPNNRGSVSTDAGAAPVDCPRNYTTLGRTASEELLRCKTQIDLAGHRFRLDFSLVPPKSISFDRTAFGFNFVCCSIDPLGPASSASCRLVQESVLLVFDDPVEVQPVREESGQSKQQSRSRVSKCVLALCRFASDVQTSVARWLQRATRRTTLKPSVYLVSRSQETSYDRVLGVPSMAVKLNNAHHRRRYVHVGTHTRNAVVEDTVLPGHVYAVLTSLLTKDTRAVHFTTIADIAHTEGEAWMYSSAARTMSSWNWITSEWERADRICSPSVHYTVPTFRKVISPMVPYTELLGYKSWCTGAAPNDRV